MRKGNKRNIKGGLLTSSLSFPKSNARKDLTYALVDRIISESRETDVWYHATADRKGYFENGSAYETSAERRGVKKSQNAGG